jgi:vanillin dehydrogenase
MPVAPPIFLLGVLFMNPASFDLIDGLPHYKLFIDGAWVRSSRNILADDINPATGKVFARTQQAGAEEVDKAIAAADAAAASWGKTMVAEREVVLLRTVDVIVRRTAEIRDMLIEECGSVFSRHYGKSNTSSMPCARPRGMLVM